MLMFFDLVGTVAFAIAGALRGIHKRLDIFGVMILAVTTAMGGGVVRDVIISNTPPLAFYRPEYVLLTSITAVLVILLKHYVEHYGFLLQVCDAVGLGAFGVAGAQMAISFGHSSLLMVVFLAVVTGVGGGVMRDIFVSDVPDIFRRDIYATAVIAGAAVFYYSYLYVGTEIAMDLCFVITVGLRLAAIHYQWQLPTAR